MYRILLAIIFVMAFSLSIVISGCQDEGPVEKAGKKVDQAVKEAGEKVDKAAQKAGEAVKEAEKKVEEKTK